VLPLEPRDPRSLGRNRILARIGVGGMAVVYFGRSAGGRAVAVKVVHAEFGADEEYRDRFLREVAATRTAGGRYSPSVVDADPDAPLPWFAMEFLPAVSLREAVHRFGPLPEDAVWSLAAGLAEALAAIHEAGVLHLDLKPGNVLLTEEGPRVIDFGIVGGVRAGAGPQAAGSPGYMSPEHVARGVTTEASDVFSLGATLAFALTGTPRPGRAETTLGELVVACTRPDPADRPTVAELRAATPAGVVSLPAEVLAEIRRRAGEAENPPVPAERPGPAVSRRTVLVAGGAAVLAAAGVPVALALAGDERVRGTAGPATTLPSTTTSTTPVPVPPITASAGRALEFVVSGDVATYEITLTLAGRPTTVRDEPLPWRRILEVPAWPERTPWQVTYRHSGGRMQWEIIVDGQDYGSGGSEGPGEHVAEPASGTI
jgi:serine/threonine protein kinase